MDKALVMPVGERLSELASGELPKKELLVVPVGEGGMWDCEVSKGTVEERVVLDKTISEVTV